MVFLTRISGALDGKLVMLTLLRRDGVAGGVPSCRLPHPPATPIMSLFAINHSPHTRTFSWCGVEADGQSRRICKVGTFYLPRFWKVSLMSKGDGAKVRASTRKDVIEHSEVR